MAKKGRVFSGARPTGRQHLGNYLGAIQNYVNYKMITIASTASLTSMRLQPWKPPKI
jgi:tryptophanyl-tRNA synthetase